jgi:hypothetical protein
MPRKRRARRYDKTQSAEDVLKSVVLKDSEGDAVLGPLGRVIGCVYAFADVARRQGKRIEPAAQEARRLAKHYHASAPRR